MNEQESRIEKLVNALELVSARLIETTIANAQVATSQTPEMRKLFDTWTRYICEELMRNQEDDGTFDISQISATIGLNPSSVTALLLAMHRQGRIQITKIQAVPGSGKNEDICDCIV